MTSWSSTAPPTSTRSLWTRRWETDWPVVAKKTSPTRLKPSHRSKLEARGSSMFISLFTQLLTLRYGERTQEWVVCCSPDPPADTLLPEFFLMPSTSMYFCLSVLCAKSDYDKSVLREQALGPREGDDDGPLQPL